MVGYGFGEKAEDKVIDEIAEGDVDLDPAGEVRAVEGDLVLRAEEL